MSFFMTLPSNASSKHYNNTQANYTTKLDSPLTFSVPYEVALVEFSYRQFISFDIGIMKIKFKNEEKYRPFRLRVFDNEPIEHLVERLNNEIEDYHAKLDYLVDVKKVDAYIDNNELIRDFDKQQDNAVFQKQRYTKKLPKFGLKNSVVRQHASRQLALSFSPFCYCFSPRSSLRVRRRPDARERELSEGRRRQKPARGEKRILFYYAFSSVF